MKLVPHDRAAEDAAYLLILVWQHALCQKISLVEFVVTEIAIKTSMEFVRARPGDRLHLDSVGASLRDVEHVGDDLELGDRFATQLRFAE